MVPVLRGTYRLEEVRESHRMSWQCSGGFEHHLSHSHSWDNDLEPDPVTGDGDTGKGYIVLAMMELATGREDRNKGHNTRQDKSGNYGRDTSHAKRRNSRITLRYSTKASGGGGV